MPAYTKHPLRSPHAITVGNLYVQRATEYHLGLGFTSIPVRGCWDVRENGSNAALYETTTRKDALEWARAQEAKNRIIRTEPYPMTTLLANGLLSEEG